MSLPTPTSLTTSVATEAIAAWDQATANVHIEQILQHSYNRCWFCEGQRPKACYVMQSDDPSLPLCRSRNTLPPNFQIESPANGIALCETCANAWEPYEDALLVLVPSDLKYFIAREEVDYASRTELGRRGWLVPRRCVPSAEEYREHCRSLATNGCRDGNRDASVGVGGIYTPILLHDYHPCPSVATRLFIRQKAWHGEPAAMIRRAMIALGTLRVDQFPDEAFSDLCRLRQLYAKPDPVICAMREPVRPTTVTIVGEKRGRALFGLGPGSSSGSGEKGSKKENMNGNGDDAGECAMKHRRLTFDGIKGKRKDDDGVFGFTTGLCRVTAPLSSAASTSTLRQYSSDSDMFYCFIPEALDQITATSQAVNDSQDQGLVGNGDGARDPQEQKTEEEEEMKRFLQLD